MKLSLTVFVALHSANVKEISHVQFKTAIVSPFDFGSAFGRFPFYSQET